MTACEGKVALVTGASQGGTGTAIAVRLAAEGADVAITARANSEQNGRLLTRINAQSALMPQDRAVSDSG